MSITKRADNFYQELVLHLKTPEKITMLWVGLTPVRRTGIKTP